MYIFLGEQVFVTVSTLSVFAAKQWFASQLAVELAAAHKVAIGLFAIAAFLGDPLSVASQVTQTVASHRIAVLFVRCPYRNAFSER